MSRLEQAIDRYILDLRRYSRALLSDPHDAEEIVQECVLRALARRHFWQGVRDPRAYLFTILHNVHVDRLASRRRAGIQVDLDSVVTYLSRPAPQPAALELRDLQRGLDRLPADQREVVLLIGLEGMSYQDAADILRVPLGTVMSRLSRGREALRRSMDGERRPAALRRQAGTRAVAGRPAGTPPANAREERRSAFAH
jgi:RNA polymerase sigma-70 factor (ECF subfamily)